MGFFSSLLSSSQPVASTIPETHAVVRQIVSVLGFDVVSSADYAPRLVPALNAAVNYFDGQIASIPGPYDISAAHYTHHPLVNELFPARQEIAHGLGRSKEVRQPLAFLVGAEQKQAFALLGARRWPNQEHAGEAPTFCDHTLRSLAASESGARQGLRAAAMMHLVTDFGEHLDKLRQEGSLRRDQWNIEYRGDHPLADSDKGKTVLANEELRPENLLRGLIAWLQRPADYLQVHAGENSNDVGGGAAHQVDLLPRLVSRDRRCWTVCFVSFPTNEGMAAIENEARPHRYMLI